jgi:hypothetical protein
MNFLFFKNYIYKENEQQGKIFEIKWVFKSSPIIKVKTYTTSLRRLNC